MSEDEAKDIVKGFSLPFKPKSYGDNYDFPEDVTRLTTDQIGNWMSRLASYRGYVLSLFARREVGRSMLDRRYKLMLAEETRKVDARTVKEATNEAMLVSEVKELGDQLEKAERNSIFYKALADVYTGQIECLSRELSRRSMLKERE